MATYGHPADEIERLYDTEITKLYDDFADQTYRCARRGLSHEDAEEIVNFSFLAARVHWERVRSYTAPVGYVLRTALNLRADALARLAAESGVSLDEMDETRADAVLQKLRPSNDLHHDLRMLLSELSPRQEQVTVLYYWIGLPVKEIAHVLGVQAGHVSRTLYDARARLRQLLTDDDGPENGTSHE